MKEYAHMISRGSTAGDNSLDALPFLINLGIPLSLSGVILLIGIFPTFRLKSP